MNRRSLLKGGLLAGISFPFLPLNNIVAAPAPISNRKKAKNIIFMVSDGMSIGTLNMVDMYASRAFGKSSNWMQLYREGRVSRALMDTASASSLVTDSAAGSSAWGSGKRVNNGALNIGTKGETLHPILQKFKEKGKKVGCVTTVPITHATPAGFCVNVDRRDGTQDIIADIYLKLKFDVMMGGGAKYFGNQRKDGNILPKFLVNGFRVAENRDEMIKLNSDKPVLGIFADDAMPYEIDRRNDAALMKSTPSLAEMAMKAIQLMKNHGQGFVLQVEGGKVDWAAHSNDIGGLIFDQLAFDEAIGEVIQFAEQDGETLVIITTDHGNSNPGLLYAADANKKFDLLQKFKHSNSFLLGQLNQNSSEKMITDHFIEGQGIEMKATEARELMQHFKDLNADQLYNENKLPLYVLERIQNNYTGVKWAGAGHTADYVELAMFGPGSEHLKPFVKNYELHNMMLRAAEMPEYFLMKA